MMYGQLLSRLATVIKLKDIPLLQVRLYCYSLPATTYYISMITQPAARSLSLSLSRPLPPPPPSPHPPPSTPFVVKGL